MNLSAALISYISDLNFGLVDEVRIENKDFNFSIYRKTCVDDILKYHYIIEENMTYDGRSQLCYSNSKGVIDFIEFMISSFETYDHHFKLRTFKDCAMVKQWGE